MGTYKLLYLFWKKYFLHGTQICETKLPLMRSLILSPNFTFPETKISQKKCGTVLFKDMCKSIISMIGEYLQRGSFRCKVEIRVSTYKIDISTDTYWQPLNFGQLSLLNFAQIVLKNYCNRLLPLWAYIQNYLSLL